MITSCKFKDLPCDNRYTSHHQGTHFRCRLSEWRQKSGVCPYDSSIQSKTKPPKPEYLDLKQTRLL